MSDLQHLPHFDGIDMPRDRLDGLVAFAFGQKDLEDARSLFASKWYDYRFLHLGHSVYLFCHYYGEAIERWRSKFGVSPYFKLDHIRHPIWRCKRNQGKVEYSLTPDRTRTAWLRAVMFADHYGIPYDKWVEWSFQYAFQCNWQRMPLPGHLYGDKLVMFIKAKWEADQQSLMTVPLDPRYLAVNYAGHAYQDDCQNWLMSIIAGRPRPEIPLRNFLRHEPLISEAKARAKFGDYIVDMALS
ncbi:hypothetical protein [Asticcacaulis sp. AND118]|uniref:hypothetical protein n=1 Tax=Asticcacaulis sp. AND118 TaxID=2840468 RepID=UPI001CFF6460|nr:hypothetical protein [Asticcacaulis sp. AND118]UDF05081.1 hypothetical protein LH365_16960 [Asticcacaulis sp. AND118]